MTQPTVNQVVSELKDLNDDKVHEWVARGLQFLSAPHLQQAVDTDADLIRVFSNHFHMEHSLVRPIARFILRAYWHELSDTITNVPKLYNLIADTPEKRQVMNNPKARLWLNRRVGEFYAWIYDYCWR